MQKVLLHREATQENLIKPVTVVVTKTLSGLCQAAYLLQCILHLVKESLSVNMGSKQLCQQRFQHIARSKEG